MLKAIERRACEALGLADHQQDRFELRCTEEEVARANAAKTLPFPKHEELGSAPERWNALEAGLAQSSESKTREPQTAEQRWEALVREQHGAVTEHTVRATAALQRRKAELERKRRDHEIAKPAGLRALIGGSRTDKWQKAANCETRVRLCGDDHRQDALGIQRANARSASLSAGFRGPKPKSKSKVLRTRSWR